jgi:amidase
MMNPYIEASLLSELVRKKDVRPREVAEFFLKLIEKLNPMLGAFRTVTADRALADADRLEKASAEERAKMPLFGVAYSLKDLTWTKDIRTTFGSKNFEDFIPPADAEIAIRLRNAGAILLGKTTTPEFGGRPTTEGGLCPPARNPWNTNHTAGGSSGGAASAIAAGLGPIAEGSDGGGSIRIPSSCCGVVGLKPARGRVTAAPVFGEQWAGFATSGPIARTVRDVATMLDVMAGPVVGDPYWAPPPPHPFVDAVKLRPKKLRLAAIAETKLGAIDPEVTAAFKSACDAFREMGHSVETIKLDPGARLIDPAMAVISGNVASIPFKNLDLVDPNVRGTWEAGQKIGAGRYVTEVATVHNIAREIIQQLAAFDALLTPTLTRPAVLIGSLPSNPDRAFEEIFAWLAFTFPFNCTGQPAFSLPNGFSKSGLPIGLQIVGRQADEIGIISLAAEFEEARPWRDKHPPVD